MAQRSDTRERMVNTAALLFQRQGYAATGWRQVIAESETPWGSQSHHFPDGKQELAVDAIASAGAGYERLIRQVFAAGHPADAVRKWTGVAAEILEASGWADGCPVATVALEMAHGSEAIGTACNSVFGSWRAAISDGLISAGAEIDQAARLATLVLASIEGALVLARADRDTGPLLAVGLELAAYLEAELPPKR